MDVIDYEGMQLHSAEMIRDLPAGGRRLTQKAVGYIAPVEIGVVIYRNGVATGALPGQLIRGA